MGLVVLFSIMLGTAWLAATRPRAAMLVVVFAAPWNGLVADFGVTVSLYQVVLLPLVGVTLVRSLQPGWRTRPVAASGWFAAYVLYGLVWSMLVIGFLPEAELFGGALRGAVPRALIQLGLFLFVISPVVLFTALGLKGDDLAACGRIYVTAAVVLAAIGWIQLAVWYTTGSNPIQIDAISRLLGGAEIVNRQGSFGFASLAIYRMSSLAGEPRQLGQALVLAMLMLQVFALVSKRPPVLRLLGLWTFLLLSAAATYSTGAAAVWSIGTAIMLPAAWLFGIPVRRSLSSMAASAGILVAVLGITVAALEARGIPVVDLIAERTIERLDSDGAVEDFDLAILDYLAANPGDAVTGLGIGDVHLYAGPYLDPLFALYAEGTVFVAKTGYLRLISEVGLIGFALFVAWYVRLNMLAARAVRTDDTLAAVVPIGAIVVVAYMANSQIGNEFWTTAGILTATAASLREQVRAARGVAQPA